MKVAIDSSLCVGHGQCAQAAPKVFEVRDDGYSYVLVDVVPPAQEDFVRNAVTRCPAEAISITD